MSRRVRTRSGLALVVLGIATVAGAPRIEPEGGTFEGPVMVSVTPADGSTTIHVTVDGSDPQPERYALDGPRPMTQSYAVKGSFRLPYNATVKA